MTECAIEIIRASKLELRFPNLVVPVGGQRPLEIGLMIEASMYLGIGLLFGALIGLVLIPLVHARAVRLTARRLEAVLPESMAEVQTEKDLLRADFAMSTRRLEITVEQLTNKTTSQVVELSKKNDIINRLKVERDAQEIEIIALKAQVEALQERVELRDAKELVSGIFEFAREVDESHVPGADLPSKVANA